MRVLGAALVILFLPLFAHGFSPSPAWHRIEGKSIRFLRDKGLDFSIDAGMAHYYDNPIVEISISIPPRFVDAGLAQTPEGEFEGMAIVFMLFPWGIVLLFPRLGFAGALRSRHALLDSRGAVRRAWSVRLTLVADVRGAMGIRKMRSFAILLGGLVVVAHVATTTRAEDFSVDLKRLAEIDETQAMPDYKLDRVLIQSEGTRGSDMPEKTFDVCIRFKDFGNVRLAEAREAGPSTGQHWREGMTFNSGLANLAEVKTGWIKDSPNLCLIAWLDEPDGRGNGNLFGHGYVILQFQGRRARVLLRGSSALNARVRGGIQEGALHSSHFSFSPKRRHLEERVTRCYEKASDRPHNLGHPFKEEGGEDVLVARIHETIKLTYRLANGKLLPRGGSLVYKAQKQDELAEVARFYLGPYATRSALLKANASLAQRYKDSPPGTLIYLAEGMEISVPVPQEWLMDHFGHGLTMGQGIDRGDQGE